MDILEMYDPCVDCKLRYGRQYTEACNDTCAYGYLFTLYRDVTDRIKQMNDELDADLKKYCESNKED